MNTRDESDAPGGLPPGPAPAEGEYVGTTWGPGIAVAWVVGVLTLSVWLIVRVLAYDFGEFEDWLPEQWQPYLRLVCIVFVLVFSIFVAQGVPFILRRLAWDTNGLEFTPIWGTSRRFVWDDVISLDLPSVGGAWNRNNETNAILHLSGRRQIMIHPDGPGYEALVQVMAAHHKVWEAVKPRTPVGKDDESDWDGVHAPAEGAYRAPWWLLPLRLMIVLAAAWLSYHFLRYAFAANGDRPVWYPREYQPYAAWVAALAAIFVAVEGIRQCLVRTVRVVQWEPDGFWLGWYSAAPRFHRWEELAAVTSPSGERLGATILTLTTGEKAKVIASGRGFDALLAVLEQHAGEMR